MYYKQEDINKLLDNLKIKEVVGEFIELKKVQVIKAYVHSMLIQIHLFQLILKKKSVNALFVVQVEML